jgi:type II secretory ATPase GspE/PulE/Tfp pilus assembly ATPase PilB-like protein
MAELDVAEPFEQQEGHLELPAAFDDYAGRVTVVPVAGGEAVAVRLLHRERLIRPLGCVRLLAGAAFED